MTSSSDWLMGVGFLYWFTTTAVIVFDVLVKGHIPDVMTSRWRVEMWEKHFVRMLLRCIFQICCSAICLFQVGFYLKLMRPRPIPTRNRSDPRSSDSELI